MTPRTYTQAEAETVTGLSGYRLKAMRMGWTRNGRRVAPILARGVHWDRADNGRPYYTQAGIDLVMSDRPARRPKKQP